MVVCEAHRAKSCGECDINAQVTLIEENRIRYCFFSRRRLTISIPERMIDCLRNDDYLHDDLLDSLIRDLKLDEGSTNVRVFSTTFMSSLKQISNNSTSWGRVLRHFFGGPLSNMRDIEVLSKDFLVFPTGNANSAGRGGNHWGLCVVAHPGLVKAPEDSATPEADKLPCIIFIDPLGTDSYLVIYMFIY